jgi:biotin operon repressor
VGRPSWRPPLPIDPNDLAVLAILEDGQTHDRADVAATLHTSIRQVRRSVSELRRLGWPVGYGDDRGYKLSWNPTHLDQLERKYHAQALSELKTLNRIRRARRAATAGMFDEAS